MSYLYYIKVLDEWTARRHLKSSRSLVSGRSLHSGLTPHLGHQRVMAMVMNHIPFVQCQSVLPFLRYGYMYFKFDLENPWSRPYVWSKVLTLKIDDQCHGAKEKPDRTLGALSMLSSIDMLAFRFLVQIPYFDLEKPRSRSWPRSGPMVTFKA